MKKIKYSIRKLCTAFATALCLPMSVALISCDDFLTLTPTNEIVLEHYWKEEQDVVSAVTGCYAQLTSNDCLQRMLIWGEVRSDNLVFGAGAQNDLQQILKENILETNNFTKWLCFYDCINRCNTVLHYAPIVNKIDPNYTDSELRNTIAEVTTLRSLCYFYLIRTFRDVPYVTTPSIDDNIPITRPATKFEAVLDSLIESVEAVKDYAVRSYGEDSKKNQTYVTRWTAYTLLADMYLWKGDYQKCIDNCDKVIKHFQEEYEYDIQKGKTTYMELYSNVYPLVSETPAGLSTGGNQFNELFGETQNSKESIFELTPPNDQNVESAGLNNYLGFESNLIAWLAAPSYLCSDVFAGSNNYFSKTDLRAYENMEEKDNRITIHKYRDYSISFKSATTLTEAPKISRSLRSGREVPHWIIYRFSDVLLMKAEAEVELAGNVTSSEDITEEQIDHYKRAFACVSATWKRANNKRTATKDTLIFSNYSGSRSTMEDLVMDERQREFMFEGKRWYDLVRMCRRDGSNSRMIEKVLPKFEQDGSKIRIKLASPDILYFPYNRAEIKVNTDLKQNPAYVTDDTYEKNL